MSLISQGNSVIYLYKIPAFLPAEDEKINNLKA